MRNTLITLAEIHYEVGIIDYDELSERIRIALWLADELDPRADSEEESVSPETEEHSVEAVVTTIKSSNSDENWLEFRCFGLWVFTKSDPDSYPSVPHGHFKSQNKKWPKLNPYTGRVFNSKHQEDKKRRLSKQQMEDIWSDEKFKSFCREMIVWYQEQFAYYEFPVRRPLHMPRW